MTDGAGARPRTGWRGLLLVKCTGQGFVCASLRFVQIDFPYRKYTHPTNRRGCVICGHWFDFQSDVCHDACGFGEVLISLGTLLAGDRRALFRASKFSLRVCEHNGAVPGITPDPGFAPAQRSVPGSSLVVMTRLEMLRPLRQSAQHLSVTRCVGKCSLTHRPVGSRMQQGRARAPSYLQSSNHGAAVSELRVALPRQHESVR
jgi:hypothetical protein